MTAQQTYKAVLAELKAENTTTMTPAEFNYHISVAQYEYIDIRYWAYEQHQKSLDDLRVIHTETDGISGVAPLLNVGQAVAGKEVVALPNDYIHLLALKARVIYKGEPCRTDGELSDYIGCKFMADNRKHAIMASYYARPAARYDRMYYSLFGNGAGGGATLRFMAGKSVVFDAIATYLRKPLPITVDNAGNSVSDPEWDDVQILEIVQWCVASYLEKIESMRFQSKEMIESTKFKQSPLLNQEV